MVIHINSLALFTGVDQMSTVITLSQSRTALARRNRSRIMSCHSFSKKNRLSIIIYQHT